MEKSGRDGEPLAAVSRILSAGFLGIALVLNCSWGQSAFAATSGQRGGEFSAGGGVVQGDRFTLQTVVGGAAAPWAGSALEMGRVAVEGGFLGQSTAHIAARHVFYNQSVWDGNDPDLNALDDAAIAPDKHALMPGQQARFENYTSYVRGLNGLIVDVVDLPADIALDDFEFRTGNSDDPTQWIAVTEPTAWSVRRGAGHDGSDRISFAWNDQAVKGHWLEVRMRARGVGGLAWPDVFYFGNAIGEVGNDPNNAIVDPEDELRARANPRNVLNPASLDNPYDFNRDGLVDPSDQLIARANQTSVLTQLRLLLLAPEPNSPWTGWLGMADGFDGGLGAVLGISMQLYPPVGHPVLDPSISKHAGSKQAVEQAVGWAVEIRVSGKRTDNPVLEMSTSLEGEAWLPVRTEWLRKAESSKQGIEFVWIIPASEFNEIGFFRISQEPSR